VTAADDGTADLDRRVADRLFQHGVRYTNTRRVVVRTLSEVYGPRSAAEIGTLVEGHVPISSLYRSLTVLADSGVLDRTHEVAGVTRYELGEWILGHHHHLVCTKCGDVTDVDFDADWEAAFQTVMRRVGVGHGFQASGHRLDVEGLCERCRMG
jgi:Fur family ferric uptake transcriptional regulator